MDLYHLHLKGNHDKQYKEGSTIIINDNNFNNRLYDRVMNTGYFVKTSDYPRITIIANALNEQLGFAPLGEYVNLGEIIPISLSYGTATDNKKILMEASQMLHNAAINKRELSVEEYRKNYEPTKPSRLHSLYACDESGVEYWLRCLLDGDIDIYRIEPENEPFQTNVQLLPDETTTYIDSYNAAKIYFNPRSRDLNRVSDEYLVQGRVKILEKVDEIRRNSL